MSKSKFNVSDRVTYTTYGKDYTITDIKWCNKHEIFFYTLKYDDINYYIMCIESELANITSNEY